MDGFAIFRVHKTANIVCRDNRKQAAIGSQKALDEHRKGSRQNPPDRNRALAKLPCAQCDETAVTPSTLDGDARPRWTNGKGGYGVISQTIHWLTAALLVVIVALGLYSSTLPRDTEWRDEILHLHKSLGLLIIALTLVRLAWIAYTPVKLHDAKLKRWEVLAARAGHILLYLILLLMPLSGIIFSGGAGREIGFFNMFTLPQFLPLDPALLPRQQYFYKLGKFLHENVFQWALYAIFALHLAGVIKHHFMDGDRDNIRRMWGFRKS